MMGLRERVLNNEECPWKSLLDLKRVRREWSRRTLGGEKGTGRKEGGVVSFPFLRTYLVPFPP